MSQKISDIVQITISRETQVVKQANFGLILIVDEFDPGDSPPFVGRTKTYSDLAGLTTDGYSSGDYVYDTAQKILSQNPSVATFKVGAKFITTTPDANWTDAMVAIRSADPDFYGVLIKSKVLAEQTLVAAWAETQKVLFGIRSDDADILDDGVTTDIASVIKAANADRSFVYYDPDTEADFIDAAAMGERFPKNPGAGTWKFKTLRAVSSYDLETDEWTNALAKNANVYVNRSGIDMTEEGKVGSGEYIDVIRGLDWLESTIQVLIFTELVRVEKIPFTDEGIAVVNGLLKQGLDQGVQRKIITANYNTVVPAVSDISTIDKGNRLLPDITFTATLQGAIHKIQIQGTVSV